jgi:hypothetical protein
MMALAPAIGLAIVMLIIAAIAMVIDRRQRSRH